MSSIILNGFRDRGIWLYTVVVWFGRPVLPFPPAVLRHCLKHVNLCEESVGCWLLWLLIAKLLECCEKCRTSSQMPNMLIWCMFMASKMVVPLLLLKNTIDGFLYAEFRIIESFTRYSIHCFPVLMFHLNGHVNKICRNRITVLIWHSVALLLAREDFQRVSVFHEHVYGEHCMKTACTHFTHSLCKIYRQGTVPCV